MALSGDRDLLDRLVLEHLPGALRFAVRLTGRVDLAEEIVQEALCRAARGIHTFRGQSQFGTWLFAIIVRAFRDHTAAVRRRGAVAVVSPDLADPRAEDPAAAVLEGELSELVAQRISALPPRQREVLVLVTCEQLSPREVAEVLGISESSVHANLHHARTRLRAELAPYLVEK